MILRQHLTVALSNIDAADMDEDESIIHLVDAVIAWLDDEGITRTLYDGLVEGGGMVRGAVNALKREARRGDPRVSVEASERV